MLNDLIFYLNLDFGISNQLVMAIINTLFYFKKINIILINELYTMSLKKVLVNKSTKTFFDFTWSMKIILFLKKVFKNIIYVTYIYRLTVIHSALFFSNY